MKALVFAAGLGTRLKPLTDNCPKALISVADKPMLWHVITRLKNAGIDEIVINVHHFADQIERYLNDEQYFDLTIHISDERDLLLDTGGGILKARKWLDGTEPFVVHNVDILTDMDISELITAHQQSGSDVTMAVSDRHSSRLLYFDKNTNRLCGWQNTKTGASLPVGFVPDNICHVARAFNGIHVASPSIFKTLESFSANQVFSIIPFYVDKCSTLNIRQYESQTAYNWFDIGKPETLSAARISKIASCI